MSSPDALSTGEKRRITRLAEELVDWYADNGRGLPWRRPGASTFERICVEVLLQQTRAESVASIYEAFFTRFHSWEELSATPVEDLEASLKPLGLWRRRARSLRGLASYAAARGGRFPASEDALAGVPAVGQYVANAIFLFQHGRRRPLLDGNMARVLERYIRPRRLADIRHDPWLQAAARWLVRRGDPVLVNWATLDFAAATCRARGPACSACPVSRRCSHLVSLGRGAL